MNLKFNIANNILYIVLNGRIDASNSNNIEKEIFDYINDKNFDKIILDADDLKYISSAGLRVVLKIKKFDPKLSIINTAPEVYDVFEMTGFTEIVEVIKAYPKLSVEGCEFIAKGANGAVYKYDDETILKVYYGNDTLDEIEQERTNARKAFVLGVNTAIPYGIVRVDGCYGTVTELLNTTSVSKLIINNPDNLSLPADYFVSMIKNVHSIKVKEGELPNNKDNIKKWIGDIVGYFEQKDIDKMYRLIEELEDTNTLLHGDYHTNNVLIQNGEAVLIDMDTLSVGHPIIEFAYIRNALVSFGDFDPNSIFEFMGYTLEVAKRFWYICLEKYFETNDKEFLENVEDKASLIGYIRLIRRVIRRNDDHKEEKINIYRSKIIDLLKKVDTLNF